MRKFLTRAAVDFKRHKYKYFIVIPVLIYFILFHYKPMYGVIIAFMDFKPARGFDNSPWVGLKHFIRAFKDDYFWRAFFNTFRLSMFQLVFGFPAPIILALILNEVKAGWFKKTVQTITYLPHFIAMVIVCGLVKNFCQSNGLINNIITAFGGDAGNLLANPDYFYPIYIISGIWQNVGWDSIIYLATLAGIDQEQYEAARVDGAGRIRQMLYITLPGLTPTISMLLVLKLGQLLSVGYEKVLLLYQPLTYEVADIISTYVYRKGLQEAEYSFSTAVNLFNSVINICFLLAANRLSKKMGQSGLF